MLVKRLFNQFGKEIDDDKLAFAKESSFSNGTVRYYIKFATRGPESGCMLDPYSPWFQELNPKIFDKRNNFVAKYEFRSVKKEIFDLYLHFLKTQKHMFLRQAERQIND